MYSGAKYIKACVVAVVFLMSSVLPARAQNPFEDAIKQLSSDNVKGYLQPAINGFGANMNSGVFHSANISDGFHIELTIVGMGTMIGDAEKTYSAVAPQPFDQTPVQTATIFGGLGASVNDASNTIEYRFQNGQIKTSFIPFAAPQLTIGNFYGTQAVIRYVPVPEIDKFPKVTLFGFGLRHSVSQYFTEFPVDIAGGFFYQTFKVGDVIDAKSFNIGLQASKSFSILTLYGGLQSESSSMKVSYTYSGALPPGTNPNVSVDFDGENKFRFLAGVGLDLMILHFNADINLGKVTVVSGGVGFGF